MIFSVCDNDVDNKIEDGDGINSNFNDNDYELDVDDNNLFEIKIDEKIVWAKTTWKAKFREY